MICAGRIGRVAAYCVLSCALAANVSADEGKLSRFSKSAIHMVVEFEIVLYAPDEQRAIQACERAFTRVAALDKALSDYDPQSELSKLSEISSVPPGTNSREPPATAIAVPLGEDLWRVLEYSQELSRQSGGAFDVTIGPLTKLWRRARRQRELPADERIAEARASVGYESLVLDSAGRTAQLRRANMRLDLGGVAKGLAAEEALAEIKKCGLSHALVRASGDIAAGDPPPGETGWRIGIAPLNPDEQPKQFVRLANRAISTSGDSRQHLVVAGRRYSHIIDPRTGLGVAGRSSVSIIAKSGMQADSVATAVSVLGPDRGLALVEQLRDVELLMTWEDDRGERRTVKSAGFARWEGEAPAEPRP